jgi:hypothetical protein
MRHPKTHRLPLSFYTNNMTWGYIAGPDRTGEGIYQIVSSEQSRVEYDGRNHKSRTECVTWWAANNPSRSSPALFLTKLYGCAVFRSAAIKASHYAAFLLLSSFLCGGSSFYWSVIKLLPSLLPKCHQRLDSLPRYSRFTGVPAAYYIWLQSL